jgi:replicative DNA helicase
VKIIENYKNFKRPSKPASTPDEPLAYRPPTEFDRLPPHSIEAERCLIASAILDADVYSDVSLTISRDSFYSADHQLIWSIISSLRDSGRSVDAVILREELSKRQQLDEIGGLPYIVQILNSVPSSAHGHHYAEIVRDKALLRRLIDLSNKTLRMCYAPTERPAEDVVLQCVDEFGKVAINATDTRAPIHISEAVHGEFERLQKKDTDRFLTYGLKPIDDSLGSPEPGELIVVGARPSMGKSTLLRTMALHIANAGVPVAFISLEEGRSKVSRNFISATGGIENHALRRKQLSEKSWKDAADSVGRIASLPIYFTDRARTTSQIRASISTMKAKYGVQIVIVDYLQRITGSKQRTNYERTSEISLELSDMTKTMDVVMMVAAQLRRMDPSKKNHIPDMDDLRDSGQIEQDADVIMFLNREDYWNQKNENYEQNHIADLHVAKCRDGQRGRPIKLKSELQYQRFVEIVEEPPV